MISVLPASVPHWLAVLIIAAAPLGELRAAIPVALAAYRYSIGAAFLLALVGSAIPVLAIYAAGEWWIRFVERRRGLLHRLTDRVLKRTHREFEHRFGRWGLAALVMFVAIPLPFFGAWTGTLAAIVFRIPARKGIPLILLGNAISAVIVTAAYVGGKAAYARFF